METRRREGVKCQSGQLGGNKAMVDTEDPNTGKESQK